MLLNAELLLQYQRCKRRAFLDTHGDLSQRDNSSELLLKLQQHKSIHKKTILAQNTHHRPDFPQGNWDAGAKATQLLMQQGVECIHKGVLLATYYDSTLLSRPDLLVRQPGQSCFGDWMYVPAQIELGKRPKLEYQIVAAFHAQVLAVVQEAEPSTAWLLLRSRETYKVNLVKWLPQMQHSLAECAQTLKSAPVPEVFISRQRCSLCRWWSQCYAIAKSQQHLSLLPGVTPSRYTQLQALNLTTLESLASANSSEIATLPGFNTRVALQLVIQAQSVVQNLPLILPGAERKQKVEVAEVELYFDIEAEPDLNLDYLLGVLVVDRQAKTETFHSLIAERPEDEELIWQQFLDLVWQYPSAPIFHFCSYEVDTVKRLAKLYRTPKRSPSGRNQAASALGLPALLERFVDVYELVTQSVALPLESYALKSIARWLNFEWRDPQANGSQCIYWYDQWLETGDRALLDIIQRYNEDDCRATRHVKDWFANFFSPSAF